MSRPELKLLGGALLEQNGSTLSGPGTRRHPMALLALLALASSHTLSRSKILGLLWPDTNEATGRNRLTSIVYALRQLLGSDSIGSAGDSLRLEQEQLDCDVWRFHEAVDRGDDAAAAELYGGRLLDGFYLENAQPFDDRMREETEKLHGAWRQALERLAAAAADAGDCKKAVHWCQLLYRDDPFDTSIAQRLVQALVDAGNRREAVRIARAHAATLRRELGVEPDTDLKSLIELPRRIGVTESVDAAVSRSSGAAAPPVVAVLPFDVLGGQSTDSLAEGLHSGILTRLCSIEGLAAIARTSVQRFRNTDKTASEIAAELSARWVLEGDIQESDGRFLINVRLIDAPADRQNWAADYQGLLSAETFFQAQAEIAGEVVERLCGELSLEVRERLDRRPTGSLEAYRLCALGRDLLDQRSEEHMRRSLECFEQALELDDAYALAWVGVADALGLLHAYGYVGAEVLPRAEDSIHRALVSDARCAEAHAALGRLHGQRNRALEAEQEIRLALTLKPGYAEAHSWLTIGLQVRGVAEDAVQSAIRAVTLDPLSIEAVGNLSSSYLFAGRHDEALHEARRIQAQHPGYESAVFYEGLTLYELGRFEEAAAVLDGLAVPWAGVGAKTARALSMIAAGQEDGLAEVLQEVREAGRPFDEGLLFAAMGGEDAAYTAYARAEFGGLDFAVSYWPTVCVRYLFDRVWQQLPEDPRNGDLLQRIDRMWGFR